MVAHPLCRELLGLADVIRCSTEYGIDMPGLIQNEGGRGVMVVHDSCLDSHISTLHNP